MKRKNQETLSRHCIPFCLCALYWAEGQVQGPQKPKTNMQKMQVTMFSLFPLI